MCRQSTVVLQSQRHHCECSRSFWMPLFVTYRPAPRAKCQCWFSANFDPERNCKLVLPASRVDVFDVFICSARQHFSIKRLAYAINIPIYIYGQLTHNMKIEKCHRRAEMNAISSMHDYQTNRQNKLHIITNAFLRTLQPSTYGGIL